MASEVDLVALSLLWTEGTNRRPVRQRAPQGPEAPDITAPDPRTLVHLDEVLTVLEIPDAGALAANLRRRAAATLETAGLKGIRAILRGSPRYPPRLDSIPDPPPVLWVRGDAGPCTYAVAVVGSRFATPQGLEIGSRLGQGLAGAGFEVVSGLARGVDAAAHRGALRGGGRTIAVLGCGVDVTYPPEHASLAEGIVANGALLSEFAPGVPPRGWHFPRRNRIISGLSLGVVIVEAAQRSGSLITARCALEQGRSVMAVPGAVLSGRNRGAHALIRDGAGVVEEAQDVIAQLQSDWRHELLVLPAAPDRGSGGGDAASERAGTPSGNRGDPVLRAMTAGEPHPIDELADKTGMAPEQVLARITRLEMDGHVLRVEGGRFVKALPNVLR
jgi:DNA processing protein